MLSICFLCRWYLSVHRSETSRLVYVSHASLLISLHHFTEQILMKYYKSYSHPQRKNLTHDWDGLKTNLTHRRGANNKKKKLHLSSLARFTWKHFHNFIPWLLLLVDKYNGIWIFLLQRGKKKRRALRLRPILPDITNELSCLGTCNSSLPSGILIITHTKPPHQSNWILERKLKMSKAINSAAAALSASQNTNGRVREGQPSFFYVRLQGKWKSFKDKCATTHCLREVRTM